VTIFSGTPFHSFPGPFRRSNGEWNDPLKTLPSACGTIVPGGTRSPERSLLLGSVSGAFRSTLSA
jgi:hypothetical protein